MQTLLQNPTAILPSGMSARDSFVKRNGYLPTSFMAAETAARQKTAPMGGGGGGEEEPETSPAQDTQDTESSVPMATGAPE